MYNKTITYTDYNGNERTEVHYFNLSKSEIMKMEMSVAGGLAEMIQRVVEAQDQTAIIKIFEELIQKSYGRKTPDGRGFEKKQEYLDAFIATPAYDELFMELATNAEAGTKKGEIVGVIAMGVSVFTNLFFVTLAAIAGKFILDVLPPFFINAFDFCLPAILGGVMAQYWKKMPVFVPLIFAICLGIEYMPLPKGTPFPFAILVSIALGYFFYQGTKKKAAK
jgi:hypothetical protein